MGAGNDRLDGMFSARESLVVRNQRNQLEPSPHHNNTFLLSSFFFSLSSPLSHSLIILPSHSCTLTRTRTRTFTLSHSHSYSLTLSLNTTATSLPSLVSSQPLAPCLFMVLCPLFSMLATLLALIRPPDDSCHQSLALSPNRLLPPLLRKAERQLHSRADLMRSS